MTIQRTTKIYINDEDTVIGSSTKLAGTLSGYVHVTTVFDEEIPDAKMTAQYRITTTTPSLDVLKAWSAMYEGAITSYKLHYKQNYEGVKVKFGNLIQERNLAMGVMRDTVVGCWVAAYDENVIAFQIHYPSGAIFQSHDVAMGLNTYKQRETEVIEAVKQQRFDPTIKMSKPVIKASRRKGSKLSFDDERSIAEMLTAKTDVGKKKYKQQDIAERFNVSSMAISKLKKTLQSEGKI
ncbi:hypothetical protein [Vibrio fortis]|uniref:hypothetical protein n=1 Tax=Vibrio fortis TaxID=212667 RepID=UPI0038CD9C19